MQQSMAAFATVTVRWELKIPRVERKTSSRVEVLEFREVRSVSFGVLFGRSPQEAALRVMGTRAGCLSVGFIPLCGAVHKPGRRTDGWAESWLSSNAQNCMEGGSEDGLQGMCMELHRHTGMVEGTSKLGWSWNQQEIQRQQEEFPQAEHQYNEDERKCGPTAEWSGWLSNEGKEKRTCTVSSSPPSLLTRSALRFFERSW